MALRLVTTALPTDAANNGKLVGQGLKALREVLHGRVALPTLDKVVLDKREWIQLANDPALQANLAEHVQGQNYPADAGLQLYAEMETTLIYLLDNGYIDVSLDRRRTYA